MIASSATAKTEQDLIMIQTITSNKLKPTITTTPNSQKPFTHKETNSLRRYHEALGKWEAAITLMPERAVLHQQKAQVLLEIGEAWNALKAATRATELEPSWAEQSPLPPTFQGTDLEFALPLSSVFVQSSRRKRFS
ncbi:tetratricopeptide repeat protein 33-like isoform X3 [Camellia sinensis]|uniref:tetratricopeptide repeat protein 33-like isoform X3 n=1 Tax=Camellia sinensis TaxID=4442 RepID=UPI00103696FB|nr:tetratricopeptide repeat protein 33-like isoform X3 [Camellia sinensis]